MTQENDRPEFGSLRSWPRGPKIVLVVILVIYATVTPILPSHPIGHDWGGDFAQYLAHAKNIALGEPYAETNYVYHRAAPEIGPRAYPPIFPLILAPTYCIDADESTRLRLVLAIETLLSCGAFFLAAVLFARWLRPTLCLAAVATLAFHTVQIEFSFQILSEHLFIPLWLLAIWLYERLSTAEKNAWWHGVLLGLVMFLAIGTRTVGIVLPAAMVFVELYRQRRMTRMGVVAGTVTAALMLLQRGLLPAAGAGYVEQLERMSWGTIASNLHADIVSFSYPWRFGNVEWVREVVGVLFAVVAVIGFCLALRRRVDLLAVASLLYFVLVVLWPSAAWTRIIWPLLPGFMLWLFFGLQEMLRSKQRTQAVIAWSIVSLTLLCTGVSLDQIRPNPTEGPYSPSACSVFQTTTERTAPGEVGLFFKPRVLGLFADRRCVGFPTVQTDPSIKDTIEQFGVSFVILRTDSTSESEWMALLSQLRFQKTFSEEEAKFTLWQRDRAQSDTTQSDPAKASSDDAVP